jgi:HPt (histidine-containing phosphotransfer) domain-containing protein
MTASAIQGDKEDCLAAGMDGFVSKPVLLEDLVNALDRWALKGKGEAAPRQAATTEESLDRARIEQLRILSAKHDPNLLQSIVADFFDKAPRRLATMRAAIADNDGVELGNAAHGLLGVSGNLGLRRMAMLCGKLQYMAHADSLAGASETIEEVERELLYVRSLLESVEAVA